MERGNPSHSAASTPGFIGARQLSPWEVSGLPRVPHIADSAPSLSKAETNALSSLWATRTTPDHQSSDMNERFPDSAFVAPCPPSRTDTGSLSARKRSITDDSARTTSPQPGEHRHMSPAYGHVYENDPSSSRQQVVAMPGTMSSRSSPSQHHPINSKMPCNKRQHKKGSEGTKESVPIGHRFTSAVKDLFWREPFDDSNYERIGDRHWSED